MQTIQTPTSDYKQSQTLVLDDGSQVDFVIEYKPLQYGWFITELTYNDFTIQNTRITCSPNMLQQYKNLIPFGLACYTQLRREPMLVDDFSNGNFTIYVISAQEVIEYTEFLGV